MEYSVLTAPLALAGALFTLPHFAIGAGFVIAAITRKMNPLAGLFGAVFVVFVSFGWTLDIKESLECRAAIEQGQGEWVSGAVSGVRHSYSRSGSGTLHFAIGDRPLWSRSSGFKNDCGFIESLGKAGGVREGDQASALVYRDKVIRLSSSKP